MTALANASEVELATKVDIAGVRTEIANVRTVLAQQETRLIKMLYSTLFAAIASGLVGVSGNRHPSDVELAPNADANSPAHLFGGVGNECGGFGHCVFERHAVVQNAECSVDAEFVNAFEALAQTS